MAPYAAQVLSRCGLRLLTALLPCGVENSEVLPPGPLAVTLCPAGTAWAKLLVKLTSPSTSVVTLFWPRNFLPSLPDGSASRLEKNWMVKVWPGAAVW